MRRIASRTVTVLSLLFLAVGLLACGGGGGGGNSATPSSGSGTLNLSLTDSSIDHIKAIYVTIAEVDVHSAAGWKTILAPHQTYNLLALVNGTLASLGTAPLAAGSYDQLRLILEDSNYFVDNDNKSTPLKVPSGFKTGIKIVGGFDITAAQATDLVLDFDAAKSIVRAGNSGQWLLKPTIKIAETITNPIILGQVSDATTTLPILGSLVSAQLYPSGPLADANAVAVQNTTLTDANGMYLFYVPPATYNVVAVREGYEPECAEVTAVDSAEFVQDFALPQVANTYTVSGLVSVSGLPETDPSATISILKTMNCANGEAPVRVQVDSVNVADGGAFTFTLPIGDYTMVATAAGEATQFFSINVVDQNITKDIDFP